ncbi:unnamed protein product, partial [Didymodactylos carnosus]
MDVQNNRIQLNAFVLHNGLYKTSKHDPRFHLYKLRDSLEIGWTYYSEKQIDQIFSNLTIYYPGSDYHTINKNSIHFAKFLLEQLFNIDRNEKVKIVKFPNYLDRVRRLTRLFPFLQSFDNEKEIAEINILYFLYMRYDGDVARICQDLLCNTIEKLKRCIHLIEKGIKRNELPITEKFTLFEKKSACDCLNVIDRNSQVAQIKERKGKDQQSGYDQITLTEIFHQFDTITLRGRTSVDRYLNIQLANNVETNFEHSQPTRAQTLARSDGIGGSG